MVLRDKLPRIYCDMDGVLCNFESAASKVVGMPMSQWALEPRKKFKSIRDKWRPIMQTKTSGPHYLGRQVVKDYGLS